MPRTTEIIAQALKEHGVTHAFGIPGGEVLELLAAFRRVGIEFVLTKQELGAGMMADAASSSPAIPVARRHARAGYHEYHIDPAKYRKQM